MHLNCIYEKFITLLHFVENAVPYARHNTNRFYLLTLLTPPSSPTHIQDDIQVILNQQLRAQYEQSQRKPVAAHPLSFLRRSRRLSTASTYISETNTANNNNNGPSPWRDWLKRAK